MSCLASIRADFVQRGSASSNIALKCAIDAIGRS